MLANLATALFEHGRITTTEAKAKRLRPFAERLVTKAKRDDLASRRRVAAVIKDPTVVHELFTEIAPGYASRPGGYTRITKIGPRKGDNAPMAVIELVEPLAEQTVAEATAATKRAAKDAAAAEEAAASEESTTDETTEEVSAEAAEESAAEPAASEDDAATADAADESDSEEDDSEK